MKDLGHSWGTSKQLAKYRTVWKSFVATLNAYRYKGSMDVSKLSMKEKVF